MFTHTNYYPINASSRFNVVLVAGFPCRDSNAYLFLVLYTLHLIGYHFHIFTPKLIMQSGNEVVPEPLTCVESGKFIKLMAKNIRYFLPSVHNSMQFTAFNHKKL